jgi:AAA+ superfamily predicted ATPase
MMCLTLFRILMCIILLSLNSLTRSNEDYYLQHYWEELSKRRQLEEQLSQIPGSTPYYPLYTQSPLTALIPKAVETLGQQTEIQDFAANLGSAIKGYFEKEYFTERTKLESLGYAAYKGLLWATIPMMSVLLLKGSEAAIEIIKYKLTTPAVTILRPESKYGRLARWKRWLKSYKTPPMIFDHSIKNRLEEIEIATKNIRDHIQKGPKKDAKYRNLLLSGKPGTGKTLFATILADKTDMDFLSVSAGDLLQSGAEGKKYFDNLCEMANRSTYGTIIFIDEADALFIDRNILIKAGALDHLVVLNHILGITGTGSNKFMLIAATNNAYSIDSAMGRRFQDRVEMPLPNQETRVELLNLYIKKLPQSVMKILTPQKIQEIAQQIDGLSHAEIKDLVDAIDTKASTTKSGLVTEDIIKRAIVEAMEKTKILEKERMEREEKMLNVSNTITA